MSVEAPRGGPSISAISASSECRGSSVAASSISAFEQAGGKNLGNPFLGTTELSVSSPPEVFDRQVPGDLAFTATSPLEIHAEPLSPKTELRELLNTTRPLNEIKEPALDSVRPSFNLSELEILAKGNTKESVKTKVQKAVEKIQPIPRTELGEILIPDPHLESLLDTTEQNLEVETEKSINEENLTTMENAVAFPSENNSVVQLLNSYLEIYSDVTNIENQETKENPSPLKVEAGEVQFNLEDLESQKEQFKPNPASYIEAQVDLAQAQKVIEALTSIGVDQKKSQKQVFADLHVEWERTGLDEQIVTQKQGINEQLINIQPDFEVDTEAKEERRIVAEAALYEAFEKAQTENKPVTGFDVASKIPQEQTSEIKSKIVKYPTVEREDGSYDPWKNEIAKIDEINSLTQGSRAIDQTLENIPPVTFSIEATKPVTKEDVQRVLGKSQEVIIFEHKQSRI